MDEWYHNGALVLWTNEDKGFNLFYNWLRDTGLIESERVTVYKVTYDYMIFIDWFAFAVNGTRNEKEYGFIHDYKDLIEDFEEL